MTYVMVRHAQGVHNVAGEKDHSAYMSEELFDAHLTTLGWKQVDNLRKHVHASGLSKKVELVVVSPLLRTMQTAVGAFGGEASVDGIDVPLLMAENTGSSNRPAISSLNCPPFIAVELCIEHLIENDGDVLWTPDTRERNEDVAARGVKFMKWLLTREEKEIAVVTHSGFLYHTLGAYGDDCHPTLKKEMSKQNSIGMALELLGEVRYGRYTVDRSAIDFLLEEQGRSEVTLESYQLTCQFNIEQKGSNSFGTVFWYMQLRSQSQIEGLAFRTFVYQIRIEK
ncbi:hypothetical protein E3N88_07199 [Mikania micrantha]|uniref:Phosphoglycerate mutase-like protein n=1 Tax=Mikania micrantha TaxID=192012 RepID=A0A5N6PQV5_9ASTR|nr:hypothetical protein E3N88_07199 [Mikania micrantha]